MKRKLALVTILVLAMLLAVTPVMAGGDKNRGDKGQGAVEQHQVNWDGYGSQRLEQNQYQYQVLTQNQAQLQVQVRTRVQTQLQICGLEDLWY